MVVVVFSKLHVGWINNSLLGDTAFNLAERQLKEAFEMGPTIQLLNFNKRLSNGLA